MLFCVARALFRHMEWRYHGVPWPSISLTPVDLVSHFVKRMNEASVSIMSILSLNDSYLCIYENTILHLYYNRVSGF